MKRKKGWKDDMGDTRDDMRDTRDDMGDTAKSVKRIDVDVNSRLAQQVVQRRRLAIRCRQVQSWLCVCARVRALDRKYWQRHFAAVYVDRVQRVLRGSQAVQVSKGRKEDEPVLSS